MIEINLLPEELRARHRQKKPSAAAVGFLLERQNLIYIGIGLGALLLLVNIFAAGMNIAKGMRLGALNKKWQNYAAQRKELEEFNKEYAIFSEGAKDIQQILSQRINWAEKLNRMSLNLPSGVWFNEFSVSSGNFYLKGAVVSLKKEEMGLLRNFVDNLKKDSAFYKDFTSLELISVRKESIGGYEVVNFILTGTLTGAVKAK